MGYYVGHPQRETRSYIGRNHNQEQRVLAENGHELGAAVGDSAGDWDL